MWKLWNRTEFRIGVYFNPFQSIPSPIFLSFFNYYFFIGNRIREVSPIRYRRYASEWVEKGRGRHQRVALIESLRGVCSSLLIWQIFLTEGDIGGPRYTSLSLADLRYSANRMCWWRCTRSRWWWLLYNAPSLPVTVIS